MKTLHITEIVEAAKVIAEERGENIFFAVTGSIIEGCRNRKTSEEYEFDVKYKEVIYDNTRDEIATSIILEAIDSLKGDDSITIEYEEGEDTEAVETSTMIINPRNEYFLRFTENAEGDLQRGTSMFKTGRMDEAVELSGLCGFSIELAGMSKSEIEKEIALYAANCPEYSEGRKAVIFEGEVIERNKNSEGVVFKPYKIEGYVRF